jgi:hypothetical protein
MNTISTILLVVAGIIGLLLIMALFMKKEHYVKRDIVINAPRQKVYDFLKLLKNQDKFNKYAMKDPERHWHYKGTDGTVGFTISWNGNKDVGEGEKEIMNLVEGERIDTQIRFVRPMKTTADVNFEITSLSDSQTKVSMSNAGTLTYPMNIFIPIAERHFPKDMDMSLATLKKILEK